MVEGWVAPVVEEVVTMSVMAKAFLVYKTKQNKTKMPITKAFLTAPCIEQFYYTAFKETVSF